MTEPYRDPLADGQANDSSRLELVRHQVGSLWYGVVQIVVHDSRVTQIERTEKLRLDKPDPRNSNRIQACQTSGGIEPNTIE